LLLASWVVLTTKSFWTDLDQRFFFTLNSLISWGKEWAVFFALANHKITDLFTCVSLILVAWLMVARDKKNKKILVCKIFSLVLYHIVAILLFKFLVWELAFAWWFQRASPGVVFPRDIFNLRELVPYLELRSFSYDSFPSDHGLFAGFFIFTFFVVNKNLFFRILFIVFMLVTMCLPRLIYGAHWFTDVFFAILIINFFISPSYLYSPIKKIFYRFFSKLLKTFLVKIYQIKR